MGSAIAERLAGGGVQVVVWNRTRGRASDLADRLRLGPVPATPREAVAGAQLVISSLTGPEAVRSAYLGPDGAAAGAHGQILVDMSTAGPDVVAEIEQLLTAGGSTLLDAPIMGPPAAVRRGEAAILVGGPTEAVEAARATLEFLGEVRHVGPSGSGSRLKLVANSMLGVAVLAAAELQSAGEAAGLGSEDVFWASARICPVLNARRDGYVLGVHTPTQFAVRDLIKDLDLALQLFHTAGSSTPLVGVTRELVNEVAADAGHLDISAVNNRYPRSD
jgi:3-hydroxyisobutyrate dehydrogenase-like beta-hydroxyacid dehydrogenase